MTDEELVELAVYRLNDAAAGDVHAPESEEYLAVAGSIFADRPRAVRILRALMAPEEPVNSVHSCCPAYPVHSADADDDFDFDFDAGLLDDVTYEGGPS